MAERKRGRLRACGRDRRESGRGRARWGVRGRGGGGGGLGADLRWGSPCVPWNRACAVRSDSDTDIAHGLRLLNLAKPSFLACFGGFGRAEAGFLIRHHARLCRISSASFPGGGSHKLSGSW